MKIRKLYLPILLFFFLIFVIYISGVSLKTSYNDYGFEGNFDNNEKNLKASFLEDIPYDLEWRSVINNIGTVSVVSMNGTNCIYIAGEDERIYYSTVLIKLDLEGNQIWRRALGGGRSRAIGIDSLGNVYIAGETSFSSNRNAFLLKYDKDGNEIWSRIYGGGEQDTYNALCIDSNDNVFVTGMTESYGTPERNLFIKKYDKDGNEIWSNIWGSEGPGSPIGIILDSKGYIYIAGTSYYSISTPNTWDYFLVKYDSFGIIMWNITWGTTSNDLCRGIVIDSKENIFISGYESSYPNYKISLFKFDTNGTYYWNQTRDSTGRDILHAMCIDSFDNIFLAATIGGYDSGGDDPIMLLIKYNNSGIKQWEVICADAGIIYAPGDIFASESGENIFLTGYSHILSQNNRVLLKFSDAPPKITINSPKTNDIFKKQPPNFNISILEHDLNETWYQLNNGQNYTFYGTTGTINQIAWDECGTETVTIKFYGSDTSGKIGYKEVNVWKDPDAPQIPPPYKLWKIGWEDNGKPICTARRDQKSVKICSDNNGGALIAWTDDRRYNERDIYAQRIDPNGNLLWSNGIAAFTSYSEDSLYHLQICSDGSGGMFITWRDSRLSNRGVYVQRVDSNGNVLWTQSGVFIGPNGREPLLISDGVGGVIVSWEENVYNSRCIRAQRINSTGHLQWDSDGIIVIHFGDELHKSHDMITDGKNGIFITWQHPEDKISASRINFDGIKQWQTLICSKKSGGPQICTDGAEGVIISYSVSMAETGSDLYAQRINATGATQWKTNGIIICDAINGQYSNQICSDGSGGAIIVWEDRRFGNIEDIFTQKVDFNGTIRWVTNGWGLCSVNGVQIDPQICSDGAGGAIVTWWDLRNGNADIYSQWINSMGYVRWTINGVMLCNATYYQSDPQICSDGAGGAIIAWNDDRVDDFYSDIYAQRIKLNIPEIKIHSPSYNKVFGNTTFSFQISTDLPNLTRTWYTVNDGDDNDFSGLNGTIDQKIWELLADGSVKITFFANNSIGFIISNYIIIQKDTTSPNISIILPSYNEKVGNIAPYFELSIVDYNLNNTYYSINNFKNISFQGFSGTLNQTIWDMCEKGNVSIFFYAIDSIGNFGSNMVIINKVLSPLNYEWERISSGINNDYGNTVDVDPYNNIYFGGTTYSTSDNGDMSLTKYNTLGVQEWNEVWNRGSNYKDMSKALRTDSFGNIYFAGTSCLVTTNQYDVCVVKYDQFGVKQWDYIWGGSNNDYCEGAAVDSLNNIYITGLTYNYGINGDMFLLKVNDTGIYDWVITFGEDGRDYGKDIVIDSSNNIYITGVIEKNNNYDFFLVKYNSKGEYQWNQTWGGPLDEISHAISLDSQDNIVISGTSDSILWLFKYNHLGELQWERQCKTYRGIDDYDLVIDTSNYIYISGAEWNSDTDRLYLYLECYNSYGDFEWNYIWGKNNESYLEGNIALDSFGNIFFSATRCYSQPTVYDMSIIKFTNNIPQIEIISPNNFGSFRNETIYYNISINGSNLNYSWYSLNEGIKHIITEPFGMLNQSSWLECEDGAVTLDFYTNNSNGFLGFRRIILYKDSKLPKITINFPRVGELYGNNSIIAFNITIDELNLESFCYQLEQDLIKTENITFIESKDGEKIGNISSEMWKEMNNGSIIIRFYAKDIAGNINSAEIEIQKDAIVPLIIINSPSNFELFGNKSTIIFNISINNLNIEAFWYKMEQGFTVTNDFIFLESQDGQKIIYIENTTWNLFGNGSISIFIASNDTAGNIGFASIIIEKDCIPPYIFIETPSPNSIYGNYSTPFFNITIEEPNLLSFGYYLKQEQNMTENITFFDSYDGIKTGFLSYDHWSIIKNGFVTIGFYSRDMLGNEAFDEVIVYKDVKCPNITILSPISNQLFGKKTLTFNLSIIEVNLEKIWYSLYNGSNWSKNITSSGTIGTINQNIWDFCGNGTVLIRFYANDSVGNYGFSDIIIHKHIISPIIFFEFSELFLNITKPEYFHKNILINCNIISRVNISWVYLYENSAGFFKNNSMTYLDENNWQVSLDISLLEWSSTFSFSFFVLDIIDNFGINDNNSQLYKIEIFDHQKPSTNISFIPHENTNIVNTSSYFTIIANDGSGSGIYSIRFKINESSWFDYNKSFNIASYEFGIYNISYYSIDTAGNIGEVQSIIIILIDTSPNELPYYNPNGAINGYDYILFISLAIFTTIIILKIKQKKKYYIKE